MDILTADQALIKSLIVVAESINPIEPVREEKSVPYVRLEEKSFVLTDTIKRTCEVVTAHNINQYKRTFHSIKLLEKSEIWLQKLLDIDKKENSLL